MIHEVICLQIKLERQDKRQCYVCMHTSERKDNLMQIVYKSIVDETIQGVAYCQKILNLGTYHSFHLPFSLSKRDKTFFL